ncbi:DUF808 domain-containing protein [Biostraticola tofi]
MSKVAARKTASVLSDDLALNAQQVSGVNADRELPVVWKVAKGSLLNKAILVPLALVISAFIPWAITPLLMIGGAYLSYEGVEKLIESWHKRQEKKRRKLSDPSTTAYAGTPTPGIPTGGITTGGIPTGGTPAPGTAVPPASSAATTSTLAGNGEDVYLDGKQIDASTDLVALENQKIKGAVKTDFILSAEIIVISLGTVATVPLLDQVLVLIVISLVMTVGVYGLVAGIVKMDDLGLYMSRLTGDGGLRTMLRSAGRGVVAAAPMLMKALSVIGTIAMFLVGGSILAHGFPWTHSLLDSLAAGHSGWVASILTALTDMALGLVAGIIIVAVVTLVKKMLGKGH